MTKWKAGDCYTFDETDPHWSANAGENTKYTLVISAKK
jgi:aspartyl/asparaginyl beta-hydroxylase (cupin superfamily)